MMFISIVFLLLILPNNNSYTDSTQIIDKYYQAIGGREKLAAIRTALIVGEENSDWLNYHFKYAIKRDYITRYEMKYPDGREAVHCYDGKKHIRLMNNQPVDPLIRGIEADRFLLFSDLFYVDESELKYKGEQKLGYYDKHRDVAYTFIFDPKSHHLIEEIKISKEITGHIFYDDFRIVNGLVFPHKISKNVYGQTYTTEYTSIILNPELPDDIFDCNPE